MSGSKQRVTVRLRPEQLAALEPDQDSRPDRLRSLGGPPLAGRQNLEILLESYVEKGEEGTRETFNRLFPKPDSDPLTASPAAAPK